MEFKTAPLDTAGRIVTIFVILLMIIMSVFFFFKVPYGLIFVLLFISIPLISYLLAPKKYYIDGSNIIIEKVIGRKIILPLKNIQACVIIPDATKLKLVRAFGNGGLFAYYGLFSSVQYGTINFQVTKWHNIVLIKSEPGTYGISPADPEGFLERINTFCSSIGHDLTPIEQSPPQSNPKLQIAILSIPVSIFLITLVTSLLLYQQLPDRIAVHFDLNGNPDRWGPRSNYFFGNILPAMITFILNIVIFFVMRKSVRNPRVINVLVLALSLMQLLVFYMLIDVYSINVHFSHILPIGTVLIMFAVILIFLGLMYYKEVKK